MLVVKKSNRQNMHKRRTVSQVSGSVSVFRLEDKQKIVACFPKIELSQESLLHQKVLNADVYVAIPYGTKYFAWITTKEHVGLTDNNEAICLFIEAGNNTYLPSQNIFYVTLGQVSVLDTNLCNHYIFHGILFTETTAKNKNTYFATNFMYDLKTAHIVGHKTFKQTMQTLHHVFNQDTFVKQVRDAMIQTNLLHFGAPIMHPKFSELLAKLQDLPYNVQYIRFRYLEHAENEPIKFVKYFKPNKNKTLPTVMGLASATATVSAPNKPKPNTLNNNVRRLSHAVFKVYPQRQQDTYKLYALAKENQEQLVDIAYIPNYKTSIMMNGIFRNVKENLNLDALEESDDEDEFENPDMDKFVDLKTSQNMMCEYSPKFRKWIPLNITTTHDVVKTSAMGI